MSIKFSDLVGKTIISIEVKDDQINFKDSTGEEYTLYHSQDCCEDVYIEDINGDVNDLLNTPILVAEEASNSSDAPSKKEKYEPDSYTWTFYKLATIKGFVDIRWFGVSNGYYSESVDFCKLADKW